jgi:hypothetical protein
VMLGMVEYQGWQQFSYTIYIHEIRQIHKDATVEADPHRRTCGSTSPVDPCRVHRTFDWFVTPLGM